MDNTGKRRNEGEGNRTAAKEYNDAATQHAKSGKVEREARDAARALDTAEGEELKKAEAEGKRRKTPEDLSHG